MTTRRSTRVTTQRQRARDVWITVDVNLPSLLAVVVLGLAMIVGLVVGWVM